MSTGRHAADLNLEASQVPSLRRGDFFDLIKFDSVCSSHLAHRVYLDVP